MFLPFCFFFYICFCYRTSGNEEWAHGLSVEESVVIDLELSEDVVDLGRGELVSPLGQSPSKRINKVDLKLYHKGNFNYFNRQFKD